MTGERRRARGEREAAEQARAETAVPNVVAVNAADDGPPERPAADENPAVTRVAPAHPIPENVAVGGPAAENVATGGPAAEDPAGNPVPGAPPAEESPAAESAPEELTTAEAWDVIAEDAGELPAGESAAPTGTATEPPPPPRSWWRRNRLALAALVVLLPAVPAVIFHSTWSSYFGARASAPIVAEDGVETAFAGAQWRVQGWTTAAAGSTEANVLGVPRDADLVLARVALDPGSGEGPGCRVTLVHTDAGNGIQRWNGISGRPITYRPEPGIAEGCTPNATEPYLFDVAFAVPAGTPGPFRLDVEVTTELPAYLELPLTQKP